MFQQRLYVVCAILSVISHIKYLLLLTEKVSPLSGRFPLSRSEWFFSMSFINSKHELTRDAEITVFVGCEIVIVYFFYVLNVLLQLQRSIAYESTKTEVSKWQPIVIQNRKVSKHFQIVILKEKNINNIKTIISFSSLLFTDWAYFCGKFCFDLGK